jgi:hypothetical protein
MEFLTIFGVLARRRLLVAVGAALAFLLAILAAGMLPFGPRSEPGPPSGTAQARMIVDHRKTVVADTAQNADTVGTQAALLADVMAGDAERDAIARRAGIPAAQLGMQRLQLEQLVAPGQLAGRAARASATTALPYVVNVWAASPLPVLTIDVVAPRGADAARVAGATREVLAALVAVRAPALNRGLVVKPLGDVRAAELPGSTPPKIIAPAVAIVFFAFWLCAIVIAAGLRRAWRNAGGRANAAAA